MSNETLLRRVLAIMRYAYPHRSIEVSVERGYIECRVDGEIVPAPPAEAYR